MAVAVVVQTPAASMSVCWKAVESAPRPALAAGGGKPVRLLSAGVSRRRRCKVLRRAISAGLAGAGADDEDFIRRVQEMAFQFREEVADGAGEVGGGEELTIDEEMERQAASLEAGPETPGWPASVEMNAGTVGLPLSLRILKKKKRRREMEMLLSAGEAAQSSVRRAFSSMVFIIRELHRFALQLRQSLLPKDLTDVLVRVHTEMNASFVWLFQHIFAATPSLMVSVMLLLANFTVHSMGHTVAAAAPVPPPAQAALESVCFEDGSGVKAAPRIDPAAVKTYSVAPAAGGGDGGNKIKPVAGATDDGRSEKSSPVLPAVDEAATWKRVVDEAEAMRASGRHAALMDGELLRQLVAPVKAEIELDDYADYAALEHKYQLAVADDPANSLLLSNFAQFLFVVLHDHDRAEELFKKAVAVAPVDAEALSRYATFLWAAKGDLEAAEEMYLQAIAADPGNPFYGANYAHFLWNTGAEDTCLA